MSKRYFWVSSRESVLGAVCSMLDLLNVQYGMMTIADDRTNFECEVPDGIDIESALTPFHPVWFSL